MLGSLSGYWLFSFYIDGSSEKSTQWMNVYYALAVISLLTLLLVSLSSISKAEKSSTSTSIFADFVEMIKMSYQSLVLIFVISIFLYVLIEQGIGTWLPTFNNDADVGGGGKEKW